MIFIELFISFFLIGLFTFGGGYAMIPLIKDLVVNNGWMIESEFFEFIGVCESTPGPIAINMATYVGSTMGKTYGYFGQLFGSFCSTFGVVLPSFIIILLIVSIFSKFTENKYVKTFLNGVKPVVVGLIFTTGITLFFKAIGYVNMQSFIFDWKSLVIFIILGLIFYLYKFIVKKKFNNILLILISAILGILFSLF